jgi:predicted ATPase
MAGRRTSDGEAATTADAVTTAVIRTPDQRLRVFISSTLGELADERSAARSAVEQLHLTPIMFELGARPHPPRALYRSYLEQSDVFVGIYWQRYGWVAPEMEISGLEDELVLSSGMPRLLYVKRPALEMEPGLRAMLDRLEAEDTASYKPFSDAVELTELLSDDLAVLLTERFDAPSTPGFTTRVDLPSPTSTFLGREALLGELEALLVGDEPRLVTLTGPGGTGKTRVAIEAARSVHGRFADGVVLVDLSAEREPDDVFAAVARRVGTVKRTERSMLEALLAELRDFHLLLVLDNFEQVVAAGAGIVELLQRCPRLTVLVTSREQLRVSGERVVPVPPLSMPDEGAQVDVAQVLRSESGRLFVDRANASDPSFELDGQNAADVAAICQRLDGLPLAVELAAARVRLLGTAELRVRLDRRLDDLGGGPRDLPARQRTLRATIGWSDALLTDEERQVFRMMSVFSDPRLADVEEVIGGVEGAPPVDVVDGLSGLVDKNLLGTSLGSDGRPRLTMLRTIREYAAEHLASEPELLEAVCDGHAAQYAARATELRQRLRDDDRTAVLGAIGEDLGNLRSAWDHSVAKRDVGRLDRLLPALWGYHEARGDYRAVVARGEELLGVLSTLPTTPERQHDELTLLANLARTQLAVRGFTKEAEQAMVEVLARFESSGQNRHRFSALRSLGSLHLMRSEIDQTAAAGEELLRIAEEEGDPTLLSEAHLLIAISSAWRESLAHALHHADSAVATTAPAPSGSDDFRVGPHPQVIGHVAAGLLRWPAGLADGAVAHLAMAVDLARAHDHPYSLAYALHHASLLDLWRLDFDTVTRRTEESLALAERHDYPIWRALALILRGAAAIPAGDREGGIADVESGLAIYRELSTPPVFWPHLLLICAIANLNAGRRDRALAIVAEVGGLMTQDDPLRADASLVHGDVLLAEPGPDPVAAQRCYEDAVTIASARGACMVELEALTRLVTLSREGPQERGARDRLAVVRASFTEGFDTKQVQAVDDLLRGG